MSVFSQYIASEIALKICRDLLEYYFPFPRLSLYQPIEQAVSHLLFFAMVYQFLSVSFHNCSIVV